MRSSVGCSLWVLLWIALSNQSLFTSHLKSISQIAIIQYAAPRHKHYSCATASTEASIPDSRSPLHSSSLGTPVWKVRDSLLQLVHRHLNPFPYTHCFLPPLRSNLVTVLGTAIFASAGPHVILLPNPVGTAIFAKADSRDFTSRSESCNSFLPPNCARVHCRKYSCILWQGARLMELILPSPLAVFLLKSSW